MIGAIDFMRAWRDVCDEHKCEDCPVYKWCVFPPEEKTDKGINDLITAVMAEKAVEATKRAEKIE